MLDYSMFFLLSALLLKHYIFDFPLQRSPALYSHKGKYGHLGGIKHAALHAWGTLIVMCFFAPPGVLGLILALSVLDGLIHYHIDYLKVLVTRKFNWSQMKGGADPHLAIYNQNYFDAIGLDQLCHNATYILLVLLAY